MSRTTLCCEGACSPGVLGVLHLLLRTPLLRRLLRVVLCVLCMLRLLLPTLQRVVLCASC